jgi:hypothetical protein
MRISADKTNPDYKPNAHLATVYLDGCKRNDVITADEERGHIIRIARDENSDVIVDLVSGELMVMMETGIVKVEFS